jgi:WD40 repeat protein
MSVVATVLLVPISVAVSLLRVRCGVLYRRLCFGFELVLSQDLQIVVCCAGGFLLSASLDKSVRLWHLSQPGCLRQFWHTDFVTSVQFHPLDAQRFVSGEAWAAGSFCSRLFLGALDACCPRLACWLCSGQMFRPLGSC